MKLREVGHKNSKIELLPNLEVTKNFVFIFEKDSINYLFISTFEWSCFKIDLNGQVSNHGMSFNKADFCQKHPFNEKIGDFSETDVFYKDVFF